jgi:hypothetical protein
MSKTTDNVTEVMAVLAGGIAGMLAAVMVNAVEEHMEECDKECEERFGMGAKFCRHWRSDETN